MTRKHLALMIIACAIPLLALIAILWFQIQVSIVLLVGLLLICPALHLLLVGFGMDHDSTHFEADEDKVGSAPS
ncbi:MAG: hypothetical protein GXP42_15920 [Chloroflexi bacterium]|nr:hypothetical protein [Chloroflexota bacterium]